MKLLTRILVLSIALVILIQVFILAFHFLFGCYKYLGLTELNLQERYGRNTYVVVTGAGSGQGKQYALGFAKRGFHIIVMGSHRCFGTAEEIRQKYPFVDVRVLIVDFGKQESVLLAVDSLFDLIHNHALDVSVLVNNVGRRSASDPSWSQKKEQVIETITAGTLPQVLLTNRFVPYFLRRNKKSAVIFITAQCVHPNFGLGIGLSNMISVPYLSVYEATNTFGCFHANSVIEEYRTDYGDSIDFLNITPGATITENTKAFMGETAFTVPQEELIDNVFCMLGHVNGTTCAHWKHAISLYLVNLIPWKKQAYLRQAGEAISKHYMDLQI